MKKALPVILSVILIFCLAGCSSDNTKEINLTDVMTKINTDYPSEMTEITETEKLTAYYQISAEDVKSFAAEIDQSGIDEVILIEAVDGDAAKRIEACLTNRYNSKVQQGASYSPEELSIIKQCSVKTDGNYVTMIVSENAEGMTQIYESFK